MRASCAEAMIAGTSLLLLLLPACSGGRGGAARGPSEKAAVFSLDGHETTLGEFRRFAVPSLEAYASMDDRTRSHLLEQMMEQTILVNEARRRDLKVSGDEIQAALDDIMAQVLPDQPPPDPDSRALRRQVEESILLRKYRDEVLLRDLPVTPEEIQAEYESHPEISQREPQAIVSQIFVGNEAAALKALERIKAGEDFREVARQLSESPPVGADRWIHIHDLPPVLAEEVAKLGEGQTSGILRSSGGYHILRVEKVREARNLSLEEAAPEIHRALLQQKADQRVRDLVDGVMRGERFAFHPENLDFSYSKHEGDEP